MEEIFHGTLLSSQANLPNKMKRFLESLQSSQISILPGVKRPITFIVTFFLHYKFAKKLTRNITNSNIVCCVLKCCVQNSTLFIQNLDCTVTHRFTVMMLRMSNIEFLFRFFCTFKKYQGKHCIQRDTGFQFPALSSEKWGVVLSCTQQNFSSLGILVKIKDCSAYYVWVHLIITVLMKLSCHYNLLVFL